VNNKQNDFILLRERRDYGEQGLDALEQNALELKEEGKLPKEVEETMKKRLNKKETFINSILKEASWVRISDVKIKNFIDYLKKKNITELNDSNFDKIIKNYKKLDVIYMFDNWKKFKKEFEKENIKVKD